MVIEIEMFESPDLTMLNFCLRGWMKVEAYWRMVDPRDELLARILFVAARISAQAKDTPSSHSSCKMN